MKIPAYSAGDLISNINGEQYGANKIVQDKTLNQEILATEVTKKFEQYPTILLAGHFCIFDSLNRVDKLPYSVFERISLEQILLLEADPVRILTNLSGRDKKKYEYKHIQLLIEEEHQTAEKVANHCGCGLYIHRMTFDETDLQECYNLLTAKEFKK